MGELNRMYFSKKRQVFYSEYDQYRDETNLVYDLKTKIIYYKFEQQCFGTVGYMSPYISENGKYCRFIDGEIVEVD